jgi:hypothetical protein
MRWLTCLIPALALVACGGSTLQPTAAERSPAATSADSAYVAVVGPDFVALHAAYSDGNYITCSNGTGGGDAACKKVCARNGADDLPGDTALCKARGDGVINAAQRFLKDLEGKTPPTGKESADAELKAAIAKVIADVQALATAMDRHDPAAFEAAADDLYASIGAAQAAKQSLGG